ncbi:MAG: hypothetical protein UFA98_07085 [Ruminococcus sp.]|nr:hypothetical protein [Ruminococcus sp.]
MKRFTAILLSCLMIMAVFQGCESKKSESSVTTEGNSTITSNNDTDFADLEETKDIEEIAKNFSSFEDPEFLQFVLDNAYSDLTAIYNSDDYIIDNIDVVYYSQEYIDELLYNSKENNYFGYSITELKKAFPDNKYVFTLGDNGKTTVEEFTEYDDTLERIVKNVAIGTGVILICVTITVATGGFSAPATGSVAVSTINTIFATASTTAVNFALSEAAIGSTMGFITTGLATNNFDEALKSAALNGSEGYKIGAISGAIIGGSKGAIKSYRLGNSKVNNSIPNPRQSEIDIAKKYKGKEQVSYLNGKEVAYGTPGSTKPDLVRTNKGKLEAIEAKNYDLMATNAIKNLSNELKRQVSDRVKHLPKNSTQRVVLDVRGRGYSKEFLKSVKQDLKIKLDSIYHDLPIDFFA